MLKDIEFCSVCQTKLRDTYPAASYPVLCVTCSGEAWRRHGGWPPPWANNPKPIESPYTGDRTFAPIVQDMIFEAAQALTFTCAVTGPSDYVGTQGKPVVLEVQCVTCGRVNDLGVKKCWWCENHPTGAT